MKQHFSSIWVAVSSSQFKEWMNESELTLAKAICTDFVLHANVTFDKLLLRLGNLSRVKQNHRWLIITSRKIFFAQESSKLTVLINSKFTFKIIHVQTCLLCSMDKGTAGLRCQCHLCPSVHEWWHVQSSLEGRQSQRWCTSNLKEVWLEDQETSIYTRNSYRLWLITTSTGKELR